MSDKQPEWEGLQAWHSGDTLPPYHEIVTGQGERYYLECDCHPDKLWYRIMDTVEDDAVLVLDWACVTKFRRIELTNLVDDMNRSVAENARLRAKLEGIANTAMRPHESLEYYQGFIVGLQLTAREALEGPADDPR